MSPFIRALALLLVSAAPSVSQTGGLTLRIDVPVVSIDVSVTDGNGLPVEGLAAADFQVIEDGVPQPIRYFGPSTAPYHAYLLFDSSGSTRHKWDFMRRAAAEFIAGVEPGDRVSIGAFDSHLVGISGWDRPSGEALRALDAVAGNARPGGTTEFYGSLEDTLENAFEGIPERRALVILTDGRDTSLYREILRRHRVPTADEDRRFERVLRRAAARRIPIYIVALNTDRNIEENHLGGDEYRNLQVLYGDSPIPESYLEGVRIRLERLAAVSGGEALFPGSIDEIVALFGEIGDRLGGAYSVGYVPAEAKTDGELRRIVVRAGDYAVRSSRDGYYAWKD